jgi:FSR family fosmidomycin resistance protein-like MFS transporter
MVPAFIVPALGSGAFHPVGSMWAANAEKGRAASSLSYFFLMGQLGLGLGPALAGLLLNGAASVNYLFVRALGPAFGVRLVEYGSVLPVLVVGLMALPVVTLMSFTIPSKRAQRAAQAASPAVEARTIIPARALALLVLMVALRSLAQPGSVNFIPVLFQARGWSPAQYGLITSSFWLASGVAGVGFGLLADRYDRRRVIAGSLLFAAPAFFLLPTAAGAAAFGLAMAAGALSGGSHSIIVVMAQSLLPPGSKGLASGAILGLIFGMGAVGNFLIGALSQAIGLDATFQLVAGAIVVAALLALTLPAARPQPPPLPADIEAAPVTA